MRASERVEEVSHDLALEMGLSEGERHRLIDDYLAFLDTAVGGSKEVRPTRFVDELWHRHILDTRAYATDCEEWFGAFVHHRPCRPDEVSPDPPLAQCGASNPSRSDPAQILMANCGAGGPLRPSGLLANCGAPEHPNLSTMVANCGGSGPGLAM